MGRGFLGLGQPRYVYESVTIQSHTPRAHAARQSTWERNLMPADLDALAAALLEKETVDEPEIRQATSLSPTPHGENRRFLIAAFATDGESSPPENPI